MSVDLQTKSFTGFSRALKKTADNRYAIFSSKVWEGDNLDPLDFNVEKHDVVVNGFTIPDKTAIFRDTDSGEKVYLATVSADYPIIKHSDIVRRIEDGMSFKNMDVKTILSRDGAVMQRMYTLNDYSVSVGKGDEISPSIRIVNSYNGSTAVAFFIDAVRLICTNGMIATTQFMKMSYRHFGSRFDLNNFAKNAVKLIDGFNQYSKNWTSWTSENVDRDRADLVLNYMPVRFRAYIESRYPNNFDGTKWGLYNAYTEAITHDYIPTRSLSADQQKINMGANVTKMFATDWYWNASKDEIMKDLKNKRMVKEISEEEVIDV